MPESEHPSEGDGSRLRKERVHNTMLIELLVSLVFIAMAYAFIQNENKSITHLTQELEIAKADLARANARINALLFDNRKLKDDLEICRVSLNRLLKQSPKDLRANDQPVVLYKSEYDRMMNRIANADAMRDEAQKAYEKIREKMHEGGTDLPNCRVTAGFLLRIDLYEDGTLRAGSLWAAGANDAALKVPGVARLVGADTMSAAAFSDLAREAAQWGRQQKIPCVFRVRVFEHHHDLDLYKSQLSTVEHYFYSKRN